MARRRYTDLELELYRIAGQEPPTPITKEEREEHRRWNKAWEAAASELEARRKEQEKRLEGAARAREKASTDRAREILKRETKAAKTRAKNALKYAKEKQRRANAHQAVLKMFKLL